MKLLTKEILANRQFERATLRCEIYLKPATD